VPSQPFFKRHIFFLISIFLPANRQEMACQKMTRTDQKHLALGLELLNAVSVSWSVEFEQSCLLFNPPSISFVFHRLPA
jgi:hypothetical protein